MVWDVLLSVNSESLANGTDLDQQRAMAAAAIEMVSLTRWQIGFAALTAAGLVASLWMTFLALRQTNDSLNLTRKAVTAELAPQLDVQEFVYRPASKVIGYRLLNRGLTTATKVRWRARVEAIPLGGTDPELPRLGEMWLTAPDLHQGSDTVCWLHLQPDIVGSVLQSVLSGHTRIHAHLEVQCQDRFEATHALCWAETRSGKGLGIQINNPRAHSL